MILLEDSIGRPPNQDFREIANRARLRAIGEDNRRTKYLPASNSSMQYEPFSSDGFIRF